MEEITVARAQAGIEKLVKLTPQTARVIENGTEKIIPAENVTAGMLLRVLPGETVPVDGVIIKGKTTINQAVMTGESLPVDKEEGDDVMSGTVNRLGAFDMRTTRDGSDSSIQRMIRLVQSADAGKAKIVGIADRWATWVVVIALAASVLTWIITGEIIRAVTILVVFCPCALVLATPTAIMAATGNASRHGFLVREGDALERLSGVKIIAFDKTGTLTKGTPVVSAAVSVSEIYSQEEIFALAAAAESFSEHPLGKAIVSGYKKKTGNAPMTISDFKMIPARGVCATVDGKKILAGNEALLTDNNVEIFGDTGDEWKNKGSSVTLIAVNGELAGYIALSDMLRDESADMIRRLASLGVTPVLLTGDNENAASYIAGTIGINEYKASCLPEDKLEAIGEYEKNGRNVCMIGDGINDAPALKSAYVGIAMGGIGSDIAVEAADIVLVDDEIKSLPHLLALSKRMMTTIKINLTFSMTLNFVAIILAMIGTLNPVVGALVHNAGSVLVIINSALLLRFKGKKSVGK